MRTLIAGIRTIAILLGLAWMAGATLDVLGLIPYSELPGPPLARRVLHAIPLAVSGVALAAPYRFFRSRRARAVGAAVLCLSAGWILGSSLYGVVGYLEGSRSWHVVPTVLVLASLSVANIWAFLRITRDGNREPDRMTVPAGQEVT